MSKIRNCSESDETNSKVNITCNNVAKTNHQFIEVQKYPIRNMKLAFIVELVKLILIRCLVVAYTVLFMQKIYNCIGLQWIDLLYLLPISVFTIEIIYIIGFKKQDFKWF